MSEFAGAVRLDGERPDESLAQRLSRGIDGAGLDRSRRAR
jgi:hypothetical protein